MSKQELVKIISGPEGSVFGSKVLLPDGTELPGVVSVRVEGSLDSHIWRATIEVMADVEITAYSDDVRKFVMQLTDEEREIITTRRQRNAT